MLSEEMLKQAAEELALAMIKSLPAPEQCPHHFSESFEEKMQTFFSPLPSAPNGNNAKMP